MSEWPMIPIGKLAEVFSGFAFKSEDFTDYGIPILKIKNVNNRVVDLKNVEHFPIEKVTSKHTKFFLQDRDVLIAMTGQGSVGRVGRMRLDKNKKVLLNQRVGKFVTDSNKLNLDYLFYVISMPYYEQILFNAGSGSGQPNLSPNIIYSIKIPVPPLPEQRAIAHILGTLDDKIELNRRMNETLEAMARAIFKSWFVDFDPVRAKAEGRDTGLPEEIADLFPDSFEETELGEVPRGWKYYSAETVADVGIGKTPPRKESQWFSTNPDDIKWVSIRDMGESGTYILDTTEYLTSEAVNKFNIRVVPDNTVLLSFKLTIGRVTLTDGEMTTNEAIAHFKLFDEFHLSSEYLYLYLQHFDYAKLGSTSSIAQAVNSKTIKAMQILVPKENVITEFRNNFVRIFEMIKMKQNESHTLAELRDTLLPKLISGDLQVRIQK